MPQGWTPVAEAPAGWTPVVSSDPRAAMTLDERQGNTSIRRPKGYVEPPLPEEGIMGALFTPIRGVKQVAQGIQRLTKPEEGETRGGISDIVRGGLKVAAPYAPAAMLAAGPLATFLGLVGGAAGEMTGDMVADATDASPGARELLQTTGGIAGGVAAGGHGPKTAKSGLDKSRERFDALKAQLHGPGGGDIKEGMVEVASGVPAIASMHPAATPAGVISTLRGVYQIRKGMAANKAARPTVIEALPEAAAVTEPGAAHPLEVQPNPLEAGQPLRPAPGKESPLAPAPGIKPSPTVVDPEAKPATTPNESVDPRAEFERLKAEQATTALARRKADADFKAKLKPMPDEPPVDPYIRQEDGAPLMKKGTEPPATIPAASTKILTEKQLTDYASENGMSEADAKAALADSGTIVLSRGRINRALHSHADHEAISQTAKDRFGVESTKDLSDEQLARIYADFLERKVGTGPQPTKKSLVAGAEPTLQETLQRSIELAKKKRGMK